MERALPSRGLRVSPSSWGRAVFTALHGSASAGSCGECTPATPQLSELPRLLTLPWGAEGRASAKENPLSPPEIWEPTFLPFPPSLCLSCYETRSLVVTLTRFSPLGHPCHPLGIKTEFSHTSPAWTYARELSYQTSPSKRKRDSRPRRETGRKTLTASENTLLPGRFQARAIST